MHFYMHNIDTLVESQVNRRAITTWYRLEILEISK